MSFEILSAGPLSTVQDLGRFGVMKSGFSQNGAMDVFSMQCANRLVGNALGCAVVEMTMLGIKARFNDYAVIAFSGGDFSPEINGEKIEMNRAYEVSSGDVVECFAARDGARCYLAVSGGIDVPVVTGSRSTNLKCEFGGYKGRKLQKGDLISTGKYNIAPSDISKCRLPKQTFGNAFEVRAVLGPQDDMFTKSDIELFFSQEYEVTAESDRMGMKLFGEALKSKNGFDIISDGIVLGSVQVPASGQPIVLMSDHQTTGGYAKIATVISCDVSLLAQAKPKSRVRFKQISIEEAEKINKKQKKYFENKLIFG